jgi:hypothetical protein
MSKSLHSGYDVVFSEPGSENGPVYCSTCATEMDCQRNVLGTTSWGEAMAGRKHKFDQYTCPNAGTDWHNQVIGLLKEIAKTPSQYLAEILRKEIESILKSKEATKKVTGIF